MKNARWTHGTFAMLALSIVTALVASGSDVGRDPDPSEVMQRVRGALWPASQTDIDAGMIFTGDGEIEGMKLSVSFVSDDAGRFLFDARGKITVAYGHDGKVTWEQSTTGAVRRLELDDRYGALLPYWFISGHWARPGAGLEFTANPESSSSLAILDFQLAGSNFSGSVLIDTSNWLPRSFEVNEMGSAVEYRIAEYQDLEGRPVPLEIVQVNNGRTAGHLRFDQVSVFPGFPDDYFSLREDATRAGFVDGAKF